MKIKDAIEYCEELMEEQFEEFGYHETALECIIELLKELKEIKKED